MPVAQRADGQGIGAAAGQMLQQVALELVGNRKLHRFVDDRSFKRELHRESVGSELDHASRVV